LFGFQPRRFTVTCDETSIRTRASQVLIANCGLLGQPPFRWGPDIRPDDGRLDVCIVRARSVADYIVLAWHVVRRQHRRSPNVHYRTAERRVTIETKHPFPVQADGEIIGQTPVAVAVAAGVLRVAVPAG
jgi:diacylglycerol kinase (ATP)